MDKEEDNDYSGEVLIFIFHLVTDYIMMIMICNDSQNNLQDANVALEGFQLWEQFHSLGTEMVITKSGRSALPSINLISKKSSDNFFYILRCHTNRCMKH